MNINFELYRIFYVVANHSNITKASEELNISQPAISKSIKNLEDQLGGNLFIRTKRGVILTEEGKEFYNYIKQAMEYINNAEKKFTNLINLETGCIKIGINTTLTKEFLRLAYLSVRMFPLLQRFVHPSDNSSPDLSFETHYGCSPVWDSHPTSVSYPSKYEIVSLCHYHTIFFWFCK